MASASVNNSSLPLPVVANDTSASPLKKLSFLDKYLTLWILLACGLGMGLGQIPGVLKAIGATSVGTTNVLVAIGLILMIYPPLAKVRWDILPKVFSDVHLLVFSILLNWVVGPFLMFALSTVFFSGRNVRFMSGLNLVGCARCIAMVLVWNQLADGDTEYCAALVALNSILTIFLYSPYAILFVREIPSTFLKGAVDASIMQVTIQEIAVSVAIYLGIPFVAGLLTWYIFTRTRGSDWYFDNFVPRIGTLTLAALLFTVVVLFASQSKSITNKIGQVFYAALPLIIYFFVMFVGSFLGAKALGATYSQCVTLAFTGASNNFELALAVAVGIYGLHSDEALMSVIGALIEIPTMLSLVNLAFYFRKQYFGNPTLQQEIFKEVEVGQREERKMGQV